MSKTANPALADFGQRLVELRTKASLTQQQLADEIGVSRRVLGYYETESVHPPAHLLPALAAALGVSADYLLGCTDEKPHGNSRTLQRLKKLESLTQDDQQTVLKLIESLAGAGRRKTA